MKFKMSLLNGQFSCFILKNVDISVKMIIWRLPKRKELWHFQGQRWHFHVRMQCIGEKYIQPKYSYLHKIC